MKHTIAVIISIVFSLVLGQPVFAQDAVSEVTASVLATEANAKVTNISSDQTKQFELRYDSHAVMDTLMSEAVIVGVELVTVIAFTMVYLDISMKKKRRELGIE